MSKNKTETGLNLPLIFGGVVVAAVIVIGATLTLRPSQPKASAGADAISADRAGGVSATSNAEVSAADAMAVEGDPSDPLAKTQAFGTDGGLGTGIYVRDVVEGDPNAPVTIIEYASWTCPYCRSFHATTYKNIILPAIEEGTVKFITRESTRNLIDYRVGLAARCEGIDFAEASNALYADQQSYSVNDTELVDQSVIRALTDQGMNVARYTECLTDEDSIAFIKHSSDEGTRVGVTGTPSVFLNGKKIDVSNLGRLGNYIADAAQ